ncbi:putative protein phosphatase 2C 33 [Curcuma longa]|uniref:putative protein phosphatase 2C 33 n=1 Tax=Curcuma longa TaxID=136217 RepID=UPI003D9E5BFA
MECILEVIRTLPMGSCLSSDGWSSGPNPTSPASPASGARRQGGRLRRRWPSPEEEELDGIWERMCRNGATSTASLFTQQGKKGTNQDAMIVWENFGDRSDTIFCGVFDGHGPNGHMVARKVRDILPLNLCANLQLNTGNHDLKENNINIMNSEAIPSTIPQEQPRPPNVCEEKDGHSKFFKEVKVSFLKTFRIVDKELRLRPEIDCFLSGTTAVTLVKQGEDLVIGNVGDSRAVLGTRDENNCLIAVQLTTDLKPSLPREAERIRHHRGRVFALKNEPEVARVWLPDMDSPGLAMARAFGDFCLKDFGLISVPEVSYRRVTAKDEFIVLATDGVWDVLSNKDVVSIVASAPTRSSSACSLVESAARAWKFKYPTSKTDDCAVVCLFLNLDKSNSTAYSRDDQLNSIEVVSFYQSNGKHA